MSSAPVHHATSALPPLRTPDNADSGGAEPFGVLDADAIHRLRELDPTGESHLLTRVLQAFETSLNRLLPQLERARDCADAAGVRLVSHTLKSSLATIGALPLSRLCAQVEVMAHESRLDAAASGIEQILSQAQAVREALRKLVAADPPADAS